MSWWETLIEELRRIVGITDPFPPVVDDEEPPKPPKPPEPPDEKPKPPEDKPVAGDHGHNDTPPCGCDPANGRYLLDPDLKCSCGTVRIAGPGWVRYPWSGTVGRAFHYVTRAKESGKERVVIVPRIVQAGTYEVWLGYRSTNNRTRAAALYVYHQGVGSPTRVSVDQREGAVTAGWVRWKSLGVFPFLAGSRYVRGRIEMRNERMNDSEGFDAVCMVKV